MIEVIHTAGTAGFLFLVAIRLDFGCGEAAAAFRAERGRRRRGWWHKPFGEVVMAKRKAVYFVVETGVTVADAIGTVNLIVGPCGLYSEAMEKVSDIVKPGARSFDVVKAHFDVVDTFKVEAAVVSAFVRSAL